MQSDPIYPACLSALQANTSVVIAGCTIRQARKFARSIANTLVAPIFDFVIIDESSQVPVSHALSVLGALHANARLVIAGDHLQMPPITSVDPPSEAAYMVGSIQTYLKKRSFPAPIHDCTLIENYRSANDLVAYARTIGYPANLHAVYPAIALHFRSALPDRAIYPPALPWCTTFGELLSPEHSVVTLLHDDEISSQGNHFEAGMVAGAVWMLRQVVSTQLDGRGSGSHAVPDAVTFWNTCVGIVTPHRAQRALIIRALEALFPGEEDHIHSAVDTVERFQGGERHAILVSFGVADPDIISGEEAFLLQLERTNVAVSRAQAKCIVVMPRSLASYIPEDKKSIVSAQALRGYVEEFCNVRIDTTLVDAGESRSAQIRYRR